MLSPFNSAPAATRPTIGFREFVGLMAALMAINALGIDSMLPALPAIARSLNITEENHRQWIIACYMAGFGVAQLAYGPLADRYGRRPVMLSSLVLFMATSLIASFAASFETMIIARTMQGMAAAASRVLVVSIIRDRYSGREMARVMSLTFIVFLAVPMLAPTIGQMILAVAPWQWIFRALALFAFVVAIWLVLRLGETLHPDHRRDISVGHLAAAAKRVISDRCSLGYTLGLSLTFGAMMGYINSIQQLFTDVFRHPALFPTAFAITAAGLALASYVNSRIVVRLGTRRISHVALIGYIVFSLAHLVFVLLHGDSMGSFILFQFVVMFCSGLTGSNFGSMAMEPMGDIAGIASSVQGTISTLVATVIGLVIGQSFNQSSLPLAAGFLTCGLLALCVVLITEKGRLFRPQNVPAVQ